MYQDKIKKVSDAVKEVYPDATVTNEVKMTIGEREVSVDIHLYDYNIKLILISLQRQIDEVIASASGYTPKPKKHQNIKFRRGA